MVWWTLTLEAVNDHWQEVIVSLVIASQIILPPCSGSARAVMSAVGCTVSTDSLVRPEKRSRDRLPGSMASALRSRLRVWIAHYALNV